MNPPPVQVAMADQRRAAARDGYAAAKLKLAELVDRARRDGLRSNPDDFAVLTIGTIQQVGNDREMIVGAIGVLALALLQLVESGTDALVTRSTSVDGAPKAGGLSPGGDASDTGPASNGPGVVPPGGA